MSTMPSAARAKIPPRLNPMTVYASNSAIRLSGPAGPTRSRVALPARGGGPGAVGRVVVGVGEAVVGVVQPAAIAERRAPTGVEVRDRVEGRDQRGAVEVAPGPFDRLDEDHRRRPGVLGVDVQRRDLVRVVVVDGAEVRLHLR